MTTKAKDKKRKKNMVAVRVAVSELRLGDEIVTRFNRNDSIANMSTVKEISICEGRWRTHVHINKMDCYDSRSYVYVAVEAEAEKRVLDADDAVEMLSDNEA